MYRALLTRYRGASLTVSVSGISATTGFCRSITTGGTEARGGIYTSRYPSIKSLVADDNTLYGYMMKRLGGHDQNSVATIEGETSREYTFAELVATTERVAQILYHVAGVRQGDVVAVCTLNTAVYACLVYGALRLGAKVSPVNPGLPFDSLAYHFQTAGATVVLAEKLFSESIEKAADLVARTAGNTVQVLYPSDFLQLTDRLAVPEDYHPLKDATHDDTILIPFSSGTTGMPKGVQLTNANLMHNAEQCKASLGVTAADTSLMVLPLFHIYGFGVGLNTFLSAGATLVTMKKYNVQEYARLTEKYRATYNLVAPPVFVSLVKNYDSIKHRDLSSLRAFISGAAPLGAKVEDLFHRLFPHVKVGQAFGCTETAPLLFGPRWGPGKEETAASGAAGAILPDTELRVVKVDDSQQSGADKSAGIDSAPNEEGELWVRGPQMFRGYLSQEDTDKAMQDGWYRTGDIGVYDQQTGYVTITDRLKELIKYKGFQVSPASIEAMLLLHPWVADCLVVGVPDPRDVSFEIPRALVVLKKDLPMADLVRASDSIYHYMLARSPPHKRLHGGVRIVDEIPRNAAGKVLRRSARAQEIVYMEAQARYETVTTTATSSPSPTSESDQSVSNGSGHARVKVISAKPGALAGAEEHHVFVHPSTSAHRAVAADAV